MDDIDITYRFAFSDGTELHYPIKLDTKTLQLISAPEQPIKPWQALEFKQCPNCPLDSAQHSSCPAARHLGALIQDVKGLQSYQEVFVEVTTLERVVCVNTTIQRALSSLLGVILPASGCPHTRFFKPMARFHLPFASEEETIYRAVSMYLTAQYIARGEDNDGNISLDGLSEIYNNVHSVNKALASRLRAAVNCDASVNAVVLLDLFASALPFSIKESLEEIRYIFSSYT